MQKFSVYIERFEVSGQGTFLCLLWLLEVAEFIFVCVSWPAFFMYGKGG